MTRPQIMPCRVCGSSNVQAYRTVERPSKAFVMCDDCGYRGHEDLDGNAIRAIHLWNRESGLKLCPFCGGAAEIQDIYDAVMAVCPFCGIKTAMGSLDDVIEVWNSRAPEVD